MLYAPSVVVEDLSVDKDSGEVGSEGAVFDEGRMATNSAFAVCKSVRVLPEAGVRSELSDDHHVPEGRRCMRAYLRS